MDNPWISFFDWAAYREKKMTKERAVQRIERMVEKFKECIDYQKNPYCFNPSSNDMCFLPYDDDVKAQNY